MEITSIIVLLGLVALAMSAFTYLRYRSREKAYREYTERSQNHRDWDNHGGF